MNIESFMEKALNPSLENEERYENYEKMYSQYKENNEGDEGWIEARTELRKKFSNPPTNQQKNKYGLKKKDIKKSFFEIKKNIPEKYKEEKDEYSLPAEIFYQNTYSVLKNITAEGEEIMEIGCGKQPKFINLLNKNNFPTVGIDPVLENSEHPKAFKTTMKNLPKTLKSQEYKLILANMVYSINYTYEFLEKFSWELNHEKKLLKKISSLLKPKGHLILIDDIGTIFKKKNLEKHFKIELFEKDVPCIDFKENKIKTYQRITLLEKTKEK